MDNKISNTISKDLSIIKEILEFLLHINSIEKEDFQFCVKKLNELENDTFFLKNIYDIDTISLLKKRFFLLSIEIKRHIMSTRIIYLNVLKHLKIYILPT